ncbi:hypothetical protein ACROYT_G015434 [Oculina patagonica]
MRRLPRLSLKTPTTTPSYLELTCDFKRATELAAFGRYSEDNPHGQDVSSTTLEELRMIRMWLEKVQKIKHETEKSDLEGDLEDVEYVQPTDGESESQSEEEEEKPEKQKEKTKKRKAETPPTKKAPVPSKKKVTVMDCQPSTSKEQRESASEFEEAASNPETEKEEKTEKKRKGRITKKESVSPVARRSWI